MCQPSPTNLVAAVAVTATAAEKQEQQKKHQEVETRTLITNHYYFTIKNPSSKSTRKTTITQNIGTDNGHNNLLASSNSNSKIVLQHKEEVYSRYNNKQQYTPSMFGGNHTGITI